ncbi:Major histocompatibility complex class I-related protein, partial [Ophiophagus hannah]
MSCMGQTQFVEVTYLDSQPIQRYDSNTERMRPLTPWINQALDQYYWTWESDMGYLKDFLEKLQELHPTVPQNHHNQSTDHTLQCIEGCKLTADGEKIEIHQDALDGKEMKGEEFHSERMYLYGNCIHWLNRYLDMRPQRKELPIVKVTHQGVINNLQALTCQAYGFYPKEISASWRKDGEIFNQTNSSMHIAPNSDGTFNARLSIQINPKERKLYRCHVEHVSSSPSVEVTTHMLNVNETLFNCSICNFYPKDIDATWKRDEENWEHGTFHGDTIRNWDGTYCTWISTEINPMEEYHYFCYVDHEGLQNVLRIEGDKFQ